MSAAPHILSYLFIFPHMSSYILIVIDLLIACHILSYVLISYQYFLVFRAWKPDVLSYLLTSYHTSSYLLISCHIVLYILKIPYISSYLLYFQSMCIPSGSPMSAAPDIMTSSTSSLQGLRKSSGLRSKPTSQFSQLYRIKLLLLITTDLLLMLKAHSALGFGSTTCSFLSL